MMRKQDLKPSRQEIKQRQKALHDAALQAKTEPKEPTTTTSLSAFEQLPTEIIQHIFFLSLEANLAVTSRTFNTILSDESVFRTLIIFAFYAHDLQVPVSLVERKHFLPAEFRLLDREERRDLQRTIWGFKWCNIQRIKACVPALYRLRMVLAWHVEHGREQKVQEEMEKVLKDLGANQIERFETGPSSRRLPKSWELPDMNDEDAMKEHFFGPENWSTEAEALNMPLRIRERRYEIVRLRANPRQPSYRYFRSCLAVLSVLLIPSKLLRGSPWTTEKYRLLQILFGSIRFAAKPLFRNEEIWDDGAMAQGMQSAIEEQQREILQILIIIATYPILGKERRPNVPSEVFSAAFNLGFDGSEYVKMLLDANLNMSGDLEEAATAWALKAKSIGDPVGQRLLQKLEGQ